MMARPKEPHPRGPRPNRMTTPDEFLDWLLALPKTKVPLHDSCNKTYQTIELMTLAKDLLEHPDLLAWWKSKNMPKHLNDTVAKTILALDPPEEIRAAILFIML